MSVQEYFNVDKKEVSEEERKSAGFDYLAGVDIMFKGAGEKPKEEKEEIIRKANEAREKLFDETEGTSVILNEMFVGKIIDRLKGDGGYGQYLGKYKNYLEEKFGITKASGVVLDRLIKEGQDAAEELFVSRKPRLVFE